MATATEKNTALTARGTVLTTELNSLANGSQAVGSTVLDNGVNLDRFGIAELSITFGSTPTDRSVVDLYAVIAPDGTNYSYSTQAMDTMYLGSFVLDDSTSAQLVPTPQFELPPCKCKFAVVNRSGVAFPASGVTVSVYTYNRQLSY